MRLANLVSISILVSTFLLSGCVVRTYKATMDRVDQDLSSGNRGYIMGKAPDTLEQKERKLTRENQIVEVEVRSPFKLSNFFKKKAKSEAPKIEQPIESKETAVEQPVVENMQKYTVQKGETLQKISQKLYGTTKKWVKIYNANKDTLSAPNKIYPGQVINLPAQEIKETKENLK